MHAGMAIVQCSQTAKRYTVQAKCLSREDGEHLHNEDFTKGSQLMWQYKGKDYPVTFVECKGKHL